MLGCLLLRSLPFTILLYPDPILSIRYSIMAGTKAKGSKKSNEMASPSPSASEDATAAEAQLMEGVEEEDEVEEEELPEGNYFVEKIVGHRGDGVSNRNWVLKGGWGRTRRGSMMMERALRETTPFRGRELILNRVI